MPTPDPRPVGETLSETVLWTVRRRKELVQAICDVEDCVATSDAVITALDAYRDAVAAEARAALLAGAPAVWVATDKNGTSRMFSAHPATIAATLQPFWGGELSLALTPPGTCIRYRLVPDPEEA